MTDCILNIDDPLGLVVAGRGVPIRFPPPRGRVFTRFGKTIELIEADKRKMQCGDKGFEKRV